MTDNDQNSKKRKQPEENHPGAAGTSSWDFKVEEKTLIEVFKNGAKAEEREKQLKVTKQEKKLQLDYSAQFKRKERLANENAHIRTQGNPKNKLSSAYLETASAEKRIKSMVIDLVLLVSLFLLAGYCSSRILQNMNKNDEVFCDKKCIKEVIFQVKWRVPDPVIQNTILSSLDEVEADPKLKQELLAKGMTYTFFLGLYLLCFSLPQIFMGVSLGKSLTKIRVEHREGGPTRLGQAIWRETFCKLISLLTLVGPFLFLFTSSRRSLHDYLANTSVADEPVAIKK